MGTPDALVYVVDDDVSTREAIVGLAQAAGFQALGLASASAFLAHPRSARAGCLVLDVQMPEVSGLDLQRRLSAANDPMPIIFVSGHGDVRMSVAAIKAGAVDFFTKPFDADGLIDAIRGALPTNSTPRSDEASQGVLPVEATAAGIVGSSAPLKMVLRHVQTVARTDATVLIQGETGTGKERIARSVHELSERAAGPFITVNCAAIPAALLESELMGHERGAFTGATGQRIGRFELALNGTLFLDEIGELPLDLQPKLLRLLQEREFERLGGTRTIRADVRVVAATNRDLKAMVAERTFREDLYYRLSVFPILVPPLRERMQDVPALTRHFLDQLSVRMRKRSGPLTPRSLEHLLEYPWPGNIRELQNVLERAVILADGGEIEIPNLGPDSLAARSPALDEVSRAHILRVLNETNWVIAGPHGAAAKLEMKRTTLNFRMKKLGITRHP
jgi:DNA-binding NtrC family response regulator